VHHGDAGGSRPPAAPLEFEPDASHRRDQRHHHPRPLPGRPAAGAAACLL